MDNFLDNKKIALFVVNLVSKMYQLDDAVLVEFHPASRFPNPEVTAMVTRDYRILYNIDRLKVAPDYELFITSFHEMRHIYQYCVSTSVRNILNYWMTQKIGSSSGSMNSNIIM